MFSERLKELRQRNNFSMDKLIELYNKKFDGRMNKSTLSRYENGLQQPTAVTVSNLAQLFGVSADYLFGNDEFIQTFESVPIPILGYKEIDAEEKNVETIIGTEIIPRSMSAQGKYFALYVSDDYMLPRMANGDIVIVRKQSDIDSGDIAAVSIGGNAAKIAKVQKFNGGISLIPFNPACEVLSFTSNEIESLPVSILGKVVELRAQF